MTTPPLLRTPRLSLSLASRAACPSPQELHASAAWIRDELDPIIARDGADVMSPDDVITLHELFVDLQACCPSVTAIRYSRIHYAVMEIAGKATRWPSKLADECDEIIRVWEGHYGKGVLQEMRPQLYGPGGRLWKVAKERDMTRESLFRRWKTEAPKLFKDFPAMRHGDLGFAPGSWWINGTFAFYEGIISANCTNGGVVYDKNGAYAIVINDSDEIFSPTPDSFTYRCKPHDPGRFRLTCADWKSRTPVRVLRSHSSSSLWAPRAGIRYEGRYKVTGWIVKPCDGKKEWNEGVSVLFLIKLEREMDQSSMEEVMRHPTAEEVDDYKEYKRLRRVQRDVIRANASTNERRRRSVVDLELESPDPLGMKMAEPVLDVKPLARSNTYKDGMPILRAPTGSRLTLTAGGVRGDVSSGTDSPSTLPSPVVGPQPQTHQHQDELRKKDTGDEATTSVLPPIAVSSDGSPLKSRSAHYEDERSRHQRTYDGSYDLGIAPDDMSRTGSVSLRSSVRLGTPRNNDTPTPILFQTPNWGSTSGGSLITHDANLVTPIQRTLNTTTAPIETNSQARARTFVETFLSQRNELLSSQGRLAIAGFQDQPSGSLTDTLGDERTSFFHAFQAVYPHISEADYVDMITEDSPLPTPQSQPISTNTPRYTLNSALSTTTRGGETMSFLTSTQARFLSLQHYAQPFWRSSADAQSTTTGRPSRTTSDGRYVSATPNSNRLIRYRSPTDDVVSPPPFSPPPFSGDVFEPPSHLVGSPSPSALVPASDFGFTSASAKQSGYWTIPPFLPSLLNRTHSRHGSDASRRGTRLESTVERMPERAEGVMAATWFDGTSAVEDPFGGRGGGDCCWRCRNGISGK